MSLRNGKLCKDLGFHRCTCFYTHAKFTPAFAISGGMGWKPPNIKHANETIRILKNTCECVSTAAHQKDL